MRENVDASELVVRPGRVGASMGLLGQSTGGVM